MLTSVVLLGTTLLVLQALAPLTVGTVALSALAAAGAGALVARSTVSELVRRLARMESFAHTLGAGSQPAYLAAELPDEVGRVEAALGEMAQSLVGAIGDLRVQRERLETILSGMVEGVLVTDRTGHVVLTNARAREILGVPADVDAKRRPLVELIREPAIGDLLRELGEGAAMASRDTALEAGDGPVLQVNAARLTGTDGELFGYVLVFHDVTELRHLEVVRRDFVANVSHEIRTPLTAIKGYAETLLGAAGEDRETARRFLAVINRHSERLGRLIDDLLTLSDLELGRSPLRLGAVAVGAAVDDVIQILGDAAARANVEVSAQIEPALRPIHADGDRLRQVLINLVDNAVKYTPAGGRVLVSAASAGDGVELVVEDTGIGIPAQALPRLTERFFRVDKARSRELGGTGLGLAIVKHIVQGHGGTITIASSVGKGTTVRVRLKSAPDDGSQAVAGGASGL